MSIGGGPWCMPAHGSTTQNCSAPHGPENGPSPRFASSTDTRTRFDPEASVGHVCKKPVTSAIDLESPAAGLDFRQPERSFNEL